MLFRSSIAKSPSTTAFSSLPAKAAQVLTQVAGSEAPYAAQAAQAIGTVKTADDRVRSLKNLATTLAGWLALDPSAPIHVRATSAGLDAEYVAELKEAAQKVKTAAAGAEKRGGGKSVTQGDLDRKDGANLLLLDAIIAAFDGANQRDASIPRLIPIATRSYFGRRVKKQPPTAATATTPAATPIK